MPATRSRILLTLAVTLFAALHLGWEFFNGGVRSHHLLNRADLPEISNLWGLLVLPVSAWLLIGHMQVRSAPPWRFGLSRPVLVRLAAALAYGTVMSFTLDYGSVTSAMFMGLFALAVLLPVYRPEYVLGFVLGMTFTFGAVLPTLVATVFSLLSALLHPVARYLVRAVWRPARSA